MSKFFIFFLCSFTLHLVLGGILLYRSGFFGGSSQIEVETGSMGEGEDFPSLDNENDTKESKLTMKAPPPPPIKEPVKKEKKVSKKVKKASKPKKKKKVIPKKPEPPPSPPVAKPPVPEPPPPVEKLPAPAPVAEPSVSEPEPFIPPPSEIEKPVAETDNEVQEEESTSEESALPAEPEEILAPPSIESADPVIKSNNEIQEEEIILPPEDSVPPSSASGNPAAESQDFQTAATPETARAFHQLRQLPGNPIPEYPKEALEQKWEGAVEVLYYVNTGGFVEQIQVSDSSGHITLDNAAIKALSKYHYELGQEGWVRHKVEFFLEKNKEVKEIVPLRTMDDQ